MLIWRILAAALAVVLIAVVVVDIGAERNRTERVLRYEKGTYLGPPDTGISEETREQIRLRGLMIGGAG